MKAPRISCLLFALALSGPASSFADPTILPAQTNITDLQAKAAQGDAQAELELGAAYHLGGRGVPKDFAKAADLYQKSAAQGNAKAMYNLGYLYHHGQGVAVDDAKAADWFQKAADKGLPAAELEVGLADMQGSDGRKQDYAAAAKWLTLAAQQKGAPKQSGEAANALGLLYQNGSGVPKDANQALFWFTIGAENGDAKAKFNLGNLYDSDKLGKRDAVQSYMWYKLASYQGDSLATHMLSGALAAHVYSDKEIAEGDKRVADYQQSHHLPALNGPMPAAITADTVGHVGSISPASVAAGSATNAPAATPAGH